MKTTTACPTLHHSSGFSLFEALAAICIIGILAWAVIASQTNTPKGIALTKLESDVHTVNQAVKVYVASGGSLSGITDPQAVLDKMKSKLSAEDDAKMVGFGGAMIDPRLSVRFTTGEEERSTDKRAVWSVTHQRFDLTTTGPGIAGFVLDETKGTQNYGQDARLPASSAVEYAENGGWIWHYQDGAPPQPRPTPSLVAVNTTNPTGPGTNPWTSPSRYQLLPPVFSEASGSYLRSRFHFPVSLEDPNTSCSSWIMYSLNGGNYVRYSGPLDVGPDTVVTAFVTGDPYLYYASRLQSADYVAKPPQPLTPPSILPSHPQFQWDSAEQIQVVLENPNDPQDSILEVSLNGSDWAVYLEPLQLSIDTYKDGASIRGRAQTRSVDYLVSAEASAEVQAPPPPRQLEAPEITPDAPNFMAGSVETVHITIQDTNPLGSELEYRLPGSDWRLYTAAFEVTRATYPSGLLVEARAKARSRAFLTSTEAMAAVGLTPVQLKSPGVRPSAPDFMAGSIETIQVDIQDPNSAGSVLEYRLDGGAWVLCAGPLQLTRDEYPTGVLVEARARSTDQAYLDSELASSQIGLTPVQLQKPVIALSAPNFVAGSVEKIEIGLSNPNPEGSALEYSLDGNAWIAYSGAFELSRAQYPAGFALTARARATVPAYVTSEIANATAGLTPVRLQAPGLNTSASNFAAGLVESIDVRLSNPNAEGASLEYRLNGGSWTAYNAAFAVTRATYPTGVIVEARAHAQSPAYLDSETASTSVGLTAVQLAAPVISRSAATFAAGSVESVTISLTHAKPPGSVLEYRLNDGPWTPYASSFPVTLAAYPNGVSVDARARSTSPAYTDSATAEASVGLDSVQLQKPVIGLSAPNFVGGSVMSIAVTLTNPNAAGSALDYRLNGGSWVPYGGVFNVSAEAYAAGLTVEARARATSAAYTDSGIASVCVGVTVAKLQSPVITPSAANFMAGSVETISVTLSNPNATGSALDYRLNGGSWVAYAGAFNVTRAAYPSGLTVEARARSTSALFSNSDTASRSIGLTLTQLKSPTILPSAPNFVAGSVETIAVTLSNPNATGSALDYRLNGGSWLAYNGAFKLTRASYATGLTVEARARATASGYTDSSVVSSVIGLTAVQLQAPPISLSAPKFVPGTVESIAVTISNPNAAGSALEYRINGGSWQAYASAFNVTRATYPSGLSVDARARATSVAYTTSNVSSVAIGISLTKLRTPLIRPSTPNFVTGTVDTISVKITDLNSSKISALEYRLNEDSWRTYANALNLSRTSYSKGVKIEARARAITSDYANSDVASSAIGVKGAEMKKASITFSSLNSSAWYLNEVSMMVGGDTYYLGSNDYDLGHTVTVDLYVNPLVNNVFELMINTIMRNGNKSYLSGSMSGLDTRTDSGFQVIGDNASFAGASTKSTKIKDLSYNTDFHMIVGYEDCIVTGDKPDYDYDDLMFELRANNNFRLTFGGY